MADDDVTKELEQELARKRQERARRRHARRVRVTLAGEMIANAGATVLRDLVGVAGTLLLSYGAWRIYEPAGYIVAGGLMLAGAWLSGARE